MFGWLKSLFNSDPAPRKISELEAKLYAPDGSRAVWGDVEFDAYEDGGWSLEIEIDHPTEKPSGPLELKINGVTVHTFDVSPRHETETKLNSLLGHTLAQAPEMGMTADVYSGGTMILSGTFQHDH